MSIHRIPLAVAGLAATVVLTACGGSDSTSAAGSNAAGSTTSDDTASSSASASSHDDADVTFAQLMTAHHQQAIEMAELAADRAGSAEVRDLAIRIAAAQGPEIETMTGWLDDWGAPASMSGTSHGGHDMGDMPGSMSSADMDRLMNLSGTEFDREFLTMMISHHQGAVDMAETEQAEGANPEAVALAGQIVADQTAQISQMQTLLTQV